MEKKPKKKTGSVLVTGASSGIGKETAHLFLDEGYLVYAAARRTGKMKDLQKRGAVVLEMDITREEDIQKVANVISERSGGVDVLVNNAGYATYGAVEDTDLGEARNQFGVNLFGLASLTKKFIPSMRETGGGRIINVSSMGGKIYTPLGAWYHASKHALEGWSDCLRFELKPFGIDVVIIEPGIIRTGFSEVMTDPMLEHSGDGAYSRLARTMVERSEESYGKKSNSSPPSVVARAVLSAARARKPKIRYRVGKRAKLFIFTRWILPDRLFDKALRIQVKW